jgi:hypothetical protein
MTQQAFWQISNSIGEYITDDLTLSGSHPITIKFKKLEEYSIYTIQQVGTDHFLDWACQWILSQTESCQWRIMGTAREPVMIMAYRKDLPAREALHLGVSDDKQLVLQKNYYWWRLKSVSSPRDS